MGFLVELSELRRRHLAMYPVEALGEPTMFLRWELYERLAIPHDIVGGPQVFQKFIRGVFRSHAAASPVLLAAWKLQSSRFFSLLGRVIGGTATSPHGRYNVDGLTDVSLPLSESIFGFHGLTNTFPVVRSAGAEKHWRHGCSDGQRLWPSHTV